MKYLLSFLFITATTLWVSVAYLPTPVSGASLPSATAVFETSLASPITSSATSMTLTANSVRGGGSLSGYTCFTVDEGSAQAETICGTVSATTVSSLTRGVSQATGTTTVSALQFAHRRGANVKITDFPVLQIMKAQLNGEDTLPNLLTYAAATPACAKAGQLCDYTYVTNLAFSGAGVVDASTVARGFVEIATQIEAASSTAQGSVGLLVLPASLSTSTWNLNTSALRLVMTNNSGKIDNNFIATSTLFATSTLYSSPIGFIGKNVKVITTTGTTSFAVPTGVTKVDVTTIGGGGAGGNCNAGASNQSGGAGGGAGGVSMEEVDVTGTTSIQVYVGAATQWSTFGTNGFYNLAWGGANGSDETGIGPVGGTASGGDLNFDGQRGGGGSSDIAGVIGIGGAGGSNINGVGGAGSTVTAGSNGGDNGGLYGAGGAGASCRNGSASGGAGAQGAVIVRW